MTYCISDIHGCHNEFKALLNLIDFKAEDVLYILGDVIDRGPESIKCLQFIMSTPNIKMLMGNHELMMVDAVVHNNLMELWLHRNGGRSTYKQYKRLCPDEQSALLDFLTHLPFYEVVKIRSKKFLLVHAGLVCWGRKEREHLITTIGRQSTEHPNDMVWVREEFYSYKALPSYTVVFGHTPTRLLHGGANNNIWFDERHKDKIGIDCGCYSGGQLAALRLEDMKAFYVGVSQAS